MSAVTAPAPVAACSGLPPDRFRWVGESVAWWAEQAPARIALRDPLATLTYGEVETLVEALGAVRTLLGGGRWSLGALVAGLAAMLALGVSALPDAPLVRDAVAAALEHHPVANPVTAVLLDFRAYDTFLEMGVLALAVLGALLLKARTLRHPRAESPSRGSLIFIVLVPGLVPLMILMAGYLLWAGTALSGGAFPAGAILGAVAVLLLLVGTGGDMIVDRDPARFVIALGLLSFIGAGAITMAVGRAFLDWGEGWSYAAIVVIEALLTLSIGGVLALLYGASAKVPPEGSAEGAPAGEDGGEEEVR